MEERMNTVTETLSILGFENISNSCIFSKLINLLLIIDLTGFEENVCLHSNISFCKT